MHVSQSPMIGGFISLALSADGRWLATPGHPEDGNTISIWDVGTGRARRTLAGHGDQVFAVTFSPDEQLLASGSADTTVKLWNTVTGRQALTTTGLGWVNAVAFSPDGRLFASGSGLDSISIAVKARGKHAGEKRGGDLPSSTLSVWEIPTGTRLHAHSQPGATIDTLKVCPDGRWLSAGYTATKQSESGRLDSTSFIKSWDAGSGRELRSMKGGLFAYTAEGR